MILDKIYYAAFDTQNLKILLLTKKKKKKKQAAKLTVLRNSRGQSLKAFLEGD